MSENLLGLMPYHSFFLQYGQFLGAWSTFDLLVEVAIMRELRLSVEESCIVVSSLQFGAKTHILTSLLNRTEEGKAKSAIITEAIRFAERNGFAHGFISTSEDQQRYTFVRREVKGALNVKLKTFTPLQMQKHLYVFCDKVSKAQEALSINSDELIRYQQEVESYAKAPQVPSSDRPRSETNSLEATREPRRGRKAQRQAAKRTE